MNQAQLSAFTVEQQTLGALTKALGHPARIAILQLLLTRSRCVCGDLVDELPLAQATVSQHLKVLKQAGLIKGEIDPRDSCYCIDPEGWAQARQMLGGLLAAYEPPEEPLCCG